MAWLRRVHTPHPSLDRDTRIVVYGLIVLSWAQVVVALAVVAKAAM